MISPLQGQAPPYRLPSNIIYFHDWRYVSHGYFGWRDAEGKGYPMWGLDPVPTLYHNFHDIPVGLELIAQKASKTEPFLTPEKTDEIFLFAGTVFQDEGKYRLWYDCWPKEHIGRPDMGDCNFVRYAESDNGFDWKFPAMNLLERNGSKANNCVYGPPFCGPPGYHGGCVFKDPSGSAQERYKMFYLGRPSEEEKEAYLRRRPADMDVRATWALYGAVSPDGLHWTHIPEILVFVNSDTQNTCEYDPVVGQYVAYVRSWFFYRRSIGRMATTDYRKFPIHEEVFWPDARMKPYELWYTSGKTKMPGTTDYHVMFPMCWTLTEDKFDFRLATSPDNVVWSLMPGGPVCEPGEAGSWDGGVAAPGNGLVSLPGDRMGVLLLGSRVPHKHPRRPPLGAIGWATWPKGRLVALKAAVEGSFMTWPILFEGRTVHVNFKTSLAGFIKIEVLGPENKVLRSFDDCDPLSGSELDRTVTWKGQSDLGHTDDIPVTLRFRMQNAEIYSVEFK
jgi:hypothetical protein